MKTNITCTRCGTVTTWTPYCPGCGAYLEFSGNPPWVPEPRIPDNDAEGAGYEAGPEGARAVETGDSTSATNSSDSSGSDAAPAAGTGPSPTSGAGSTQEGAPTAAATTGDGSAESGIPDSTSDHSAAAAAGAAETSGHGRRRRHAKEDKPPKAARPKRRFGGEAPWWRFWDRPDQHPESAPAAPPPPAEPEGPHEGDEVSPFQYVVEAPEVPATVSAESPARQEEVQKRTIPIGRPDDLGVPGGIPCPNCRFRNYVDASYCARCGYPLRSAVPEVWTPSTVLAPSDKPPRRTDWSFLVLVGIGIFVLGVIFLAPPGEPVRAGIGNVIRSFAYWLDPDLGTPATVSNVEASSTGYGNPATSIVGDDSRTFWASAPSKTLGAGTELTFKFDAPTTIDRMVIRPGIQNGQFAVRALATPENLTLVFVALDPDTPDPSASPTDSASGSTGAPPSGSTSASTTSSATPSVGSPTGSPSSTKGSSSPSSTKGSSSPSGSPSASGSTSPTPKPTPTATPSVQASLPMIVEPTDWTTVVTFPAVYTEKVTVRIETVFPPALPDTYTTNGDGQVAISAIQFLEQWTLGQMFGFTYRQEATPVPSPSPSGSSGSPSPSSSKSGSPSPSSSKSGSPSPSSSKS